ncbi:TetR/AcrR family transcriptional regulator [Corynebacterium sp. A21]|uniref:TetR/AcrR family transcriptional regulator n=1 Tax=Corynebacterium sp. A21 TaxID=3457318 RepID=UPI003FD37FFC
MNLDDSDTSSADDAQGIADETVSPEQVIDVAVEMFADKGFPDTRLEQIAKISGMSKRMIHYHFGDKQGLYHRALSEALHRLHPEAEDMELDSTVPVEGVRKVVDALHRQYRRHPEAMRMFVLENLHPQADYSEVPTLKDDASITLHLDKLLMLGQDAGAFRPGIAAEDVFTLISALSCYPVTHGPGFDQSFGVDLHTEENQAGLHRLVVDSVLAFLTSNIPHNGRDSYLTVQATVEDTPISSQGIYADEE